MDEWAALGRTRIKKTLRAGQAGTRRLSERFGGRLVCVRHRRDPLGVYRYTTVEIVVAESPVHRERFMRARFGIWLRHHESGMRRTLTARGARWDPMDRLWWVLGKDILELKLVGRLQAL